MSALRDPPRPRTLQCESEKGQVRSQAPQQHLVQYVTFILTSISNLKKKIIVIISQSFGTKGSKRFECSKCSMQLANSYSLSQHLRIHLGVKPYQCVTCKRKFTQLSQLQQHSRIHLGVRPYLCQICPWRFTQLSHLQQHVRLHMGDKPFKCHYPTCTKAFVQSSGLNNHLKCHQMGKL